MAALGAKIPASAVTTLSWYPCPGLWLCQNLVSCEHMQTACLKSDNLTFLVVLAITLTSSFECMVLTSMTICQHGAPCVANCGRITYRLSTFFWNPSKSNFSGFWHVINVVSWLKQSVSHLSRHEGEGSRRCNISTETGC